MARLRVFISSTYYDLKYIRAGLSSFVESLGFEPILFEKGDIPFHHDRTLEESCLQEVAMADILVLIIGGRFGSPSKEDEERIKTNPEEHFSRIRSVTNKEYSQSQLKDIATFSFVEQSVFAEYRTFRANRGNDSIKYAHVDDPRIYEMIDDIMKETRGSFVKEFSGIEDITSWLRDQWAGIFADLLRKRSVNTQIRNLEDQLNDLSDLVGSLKAYNEEIVRSVSAGASQTLIEDENKRLLDIRKDRLFNEDLVLFIRNHLQAPRELNAENIFEAFQASDSCRGFIESLGFDPQEISRFMQGAEETLGRGFNELKKRYERSHVA